MPHYHTIKPLLHQFDFYNRHIFIRADLNVPIFQENEILNDFRLKAIDTTIDYILKNNGNITLATHLGAHKKPYRSTKILESWFEKKYKANIKLTKNLYSYSHEMNINKNNIESWEQSIISNYDYYINDAFGTVHRARRSLINLPSHFINAQPKSAKNCISIGFLMRKELITLYEQVIYQQSPLLLMIGGKKIGKLEYINNIIQQCSIETILLSPLLCVPFLTTHQLDPAHELFTTVEMLKKYIPSIIKIPHDFLVEEHDNKGFIKEKSIDSLKTTDTLVAIGTSTAHTWSEYINHCKTLFFNGPMGYHSNNESRKTLQYILQKIASAPGYKIIGGGDSLEACFNYGLNKNINYLSTGGGAVLAYLSGQKLLPLEIFIHQQQSN